MINTDEPRSFPYQDLTTSGIRARAPYIDSPTVGDRQSRTFTVEFIMKGTYYVSSHIVKLLANKHPLNV